MSVKKGSLYIAGGGGGSSRNIGDIFYTTRTDTALAGAVECNGGTYSTADYTGAGSIGELLASGKLPYVSLADYATQITNNGVCGVFGWDGTGTTAFRVPTLKDMFIECGQANELGDYLAPALPDPNISTTITVRTNKDGISHNYGNAGNQIVTGAAAGTFVQKSGLTPSSVTNSVYTGTTVQPEAVKYRAMVQLFNSTTDEAVATVGTVVADVSNLKDMSNITATGKETVVGWGMPDYTAGVQITTTAQTAPKNGWIIGYVAFSGSNVNADVYIDDKIVGRYGWTSSANWFGASVQVPIKAGQTFRVSSNGTIQDNKMYFYPNNE